MSGWTLHMLNARNQLCSCVKLVESVLREAEVQLVELTPSIMLDVVISASDHPMPEIFAVNGSSYSAGCIEISIDVTRVQSDGTIRENLRKTIFHEFHHVLRWDGPGYGETLGEALVSEGLAQRFVHEMMECDAEPWEKAIPTVECESYRERVRRAFDDREYSHQEWFFGAGELPNWLGYTMGNLLIEKYLSFHPECTALKLAHRSSNEFRDLLEAKL
jgi:Predicted Zn-dependent protease (DUF2268)